MKRKFDPVREASIFCFLLLFVLAEASDDLISINCGSASSSRAVNGREWLGDGYALFSSSVVAVTGSSSRTSVSGEHPVSVDPVPYRTARISRSQFSYNFRLKPGLKYIRLHFNPTSYKFSSGFKRLDDFFSVEAGPFTLLSNFSASITAHALGVDTFTKEFCINVEDKPFSLVFSPSVETNPSQAFYSFVNGIEIVSAPSSLSYCHSAEIGVEIVGKKSVFYIDSTTALEMVHQFNIKMSFVPPDSRGMFRMDANVVKERRNKVKDNNWKISVDVGFRYLVRLYFSEIGVKMAESGQNFILLINDKIVVSNADMLQQRVEKDKLWYKNYIVMVKGQKQEGRRDISISLYSKDEFVDGNGPLEGYDIFKLSNPDNSLASPNPLPPSVDNIRNWLAVFGPTNAIATLIVAAICLVNSGAHMLQQCRVLNSIEEVASTRATRRCRRFSLTEIRSATDNFFDGFVIGRGGFGKVYKGSIDNGLQTVAIKRLKSNSKQGMHEFQTEIETLSDLRHTNLVSLVGYCYEHKEMILVYEHMPCGSLADHLYKLSRKKKASSSLSWKQRLDICIGASRGIDYLHTGLGIMHRDIKPSNILLDESFVAKVADFGLAKSQIEQTHASTNFKGTIGYVDPDYFRTHRLTMESDTYSFGVVLLEVLCGRPAVDPLAEEDERSLTIWALDKINKRQIDQIVDPNLREEISPASLNAFVKVVEKCLHEKPKKRPAMVQIIIKLESALKLQEKVNSMVSVETSTIADVPVGDTPQPKNTNFLASDAVLTQQENMNRVSPTEINVADPMPYTDEALLEKAKYLFPTEIAFAADVLSASNARAMTSSNVQNIRSFSEQLNSRRINAGKRNGVKFTMRKLSRLWRWDAFRKNTKSSEKKEGISTVSAPL